jgi:hypothetical protein
VASIFEANGAIDHGGLLRNTLSTGRAGVKRFHVDDTTLVAVERANPES